MRPLCLLIALYVFGLSLITCTDGVLHHDCGTAVHFHGSNDNANHQDGDDCSPFCICACCNAAVVSGPSFVLPVHAPIVAGYFSVEFPFHSADGPAIWQPPKIG